MRLNSTLSSPPILLFDGFCNLCNAAVQAVIKRDPEGLFQFASLQSQAARYLFMKHSLSTADFDSVVLIVAGKIFIKSDAILQVASELGGFYSLLPALRILPKFMRDSIYDWVAKNRYGWFGKRESCMIPTDELNNRFLP